MTIYVFIVNAIHINHVLRREALIFLRGNAANAEVCGARTDGKSAGSGLTAIIAGQTV